MTTTKWRVQRHQLPWKNHDGEWFAVPVVDSANQGMYFPTHAEALAYAEKMARTITVTLPTYQTPTTINAEPASPVTIYAAGPLTQIEAGGVRLNLFRHELEQVALALLAHARKVVN